VALILTRYLTESRFKLANECPTKLFYTAKKDVYHDTGLNDEFLVPLTECEHQVGAFAPIAHFAFLWLDGASRAELAPTQIER
jgi:hypothetical protein